MSKFNTLVLLSGAMALMTVLMFKIGPSNHPDSPSLTQPEQADQAQLASSGRSASQNHEGHTHADSVAEHGRRLIKKKGSDSRERKEKFAERNRLPLAAHQRRSEVPPPKRPSLAGKDDFSKELRRLDALADKNHRVQGLLRLLPRLSNPLQFSRAGLLLGSIDPASAFKAIAGIVRTETNAERLAAGLTLLGQLAPTGAMTSASELLNSGSSAAVKKTAAVYMVELVKSKPYLTYPAVSTLKYAAENESDPSVAKTMKTSEEQIRSNAAKKNDVTIPPR